MSRLPFSASRQKPFPKLNGSSNRRSAPVPGRSNVAKQAVAGFANARCSLGIAVAGDGHTPSAVARPQPLISVRQRQMTTQRHSAAEPPPKERGQPCPRVAWALRGTRGQGCPRSWKISAERDDVGRWHCKGLCRRPPFPAPWRLCAFALNSVSRKSARGLAHSRTLRAFGGHRPARQRVLDFRLRQTSARQVGGKRSATPLSHARKAFH